MGLSLGVACALGVALLGLALAARQARRWGQRLRVLALESLDPWGDWTRGSRIRAEFGAGIYPVLRDLEARGLIERREGPSTLAELVARGGGPVCWYRITLSGVEYLARAGR